MSIAKIGLAIHQRTRLHQQKLEYKAAGTEMPTRGIAREKDMLECCCGMKFSRKWQRCHERSETHLKYMASLRGS